MVARATLAAVALACVSHIWANRPAERRDASGNVVAESSLAEHNSGNPGDGLFRQDVNLALSDPMYDKQSIFPAPSTGMGGSMGGQMNWRDASKDTEIHAVVNGEYVFDGIKGNIEQQGNQLSWNWGNKAFDGIMSRKDDGSVVINFKNKFNHAAYPYDIVVGDSCQSENSPCTLTVNNEQQTELKRSLASSQQMQDTWKDKSLFSGEFTHGRNLAIGHGVAGLDPELAAITASGLEDACDVAQVKASKQGHEAIKQLRRCTELLEAFSQATRHGHQHSTEANRAYVASFATVLKLLNELGGPDAIQKMNQAFTDDQMEAMSYLRGITQDIDATLTQLRDKE